MFSPSHFYGLLGASAMALLFLLLVAAGGSPVSTQGLAALDPRVVDDPTVRRSN